MKIIHVSDFHLEGGYNRVGNEKNKLLREESLQLFAGMIEYAQQNGVSVIMICGDLFDKLVVRKSTFKFVTECIRSAPQIRFFYCLGNHDHESMFDEDIPKNLTIFPVEFEKYDLGEVVIGGSSVIKYSRNDFVKSIQFDPDRLNIMMLHAYLSASKFDDCLTFEVKDIRNKNIDYLALGHIHKRMNGKIDDRGEWVYAGNGAEYGFGDYPRGFVLIEIVDGKLAWRRVNFAVKRNFLDVYVQLDDIQNYKALESKVEEALKSISQDDCVRVFLKGECDEDLDKRLDLLKEKFESRFFYFDIRDESKIRIDVEKCRLEKLSLKAEMINLIMDEPDLSDHDKQQYIKIGIQALRGEEVEI